MKHAVKFLFSGCLLLSTTSGAIEYDALVKAVTAVESAGNPQAVGLAGERGLMQIKSGTWRDMTQRAYGKSLPFDYAFHGDLNQRMGRTYLEYIATQLEPRFASRRQDDLLRIVVACYNLGPTAVSNKGYAVKHLPRQTRDYVGRVLNMYDYYLSAAQPAPVEDALSAQGVPVPFLIDNTIAPGETRELMLIEEEASILAAIPTRLAPSLSAGRAGALRPHSIIHYQQAGISSLLPLFMLAVIWSLYRAHLRTRFIDQLLDEMLGADSETPEESSLNSSTSGLPLVPGPESVYA